MGNDTGRSTDSERNNTDSGRNARRNDKRRNDREAIIPIEGKMIEY